MGWGVTAGGYLASRGILFVPHSTFLQFEQTFRNTEVLYKNMDLDFSWKIRHVGPLGSPSFMATVGYWCLALASYVKGSSCRESQCFGPSALPTWCLQGLHLFPIFWSSLLKISELFLYLCTWPFLRRHADLHDNYGFVNFSPFLLYILQLCYEVHETCLFLV